MFDSRERQEGRLDRKDFLPRRWRRIDHDLSADVTPGSWRTPSSCRATHISPSAWLRFRRHALGQRKLCTQNVAYMPSCRRPNLSFIRPCTDMVLLIHSKAQPHNRCPSRSNWVGLTRSMDQKAHRQQEQVSDSHVCVSPRLCGFISCGVVLRCRCPVLRCHKLLMSSATSGLVFNEAWFNCCCLHPARPPHLESFY